MALVSVESLSIHYRGPALLDEVSFQLEANQRVGLLGRNGAGKSTLLKLLCGEVQPDSGQISLSPGVRLAMLPQDVPRDTGGRVREVVEQGLARAAEHLEAWQGQHQVDQILGRMDLDGDRSFGDLSSGMKRRVLLAQTLVAAPDILMLDEPTNHLDIEAIEWLENFLLRWPATLMFVTHDRMFLRRLATRILEIDRGQLFDWSCDYDTFLRRKEELLAAEEKQAALFDKKLAQEEVWIRTGIKARRTRNEGRVRALEDMRRQRQQRRSQPGQVRLAIQEAERSGNLVIEADDISFSYERRPIVQNFSLMVTRGDKIGLIGPNGVGKTTLLRLLLGQLEPQSGQLRLGTNLRVAYFDQLREQLNENQTVQENVGDGYDTVQIGDQRRHVLGYLQDFLFTPERARTEIRFLSGGERNRVLLAKLFAKPANVIVLDEPTNDLDAETIEMLEERLAEFTGTVLLVSHDRSFLNNVVTSSIVFEPGGAKEYVGGYDDWVRQRPADWNRSARPATSEPVRAKSSVADSAPAPAPVTAAAKRRKLSFKEQQELDRLPAEVERLETEIESLHAAMAQPGFYQQSGPEIARSKDQLDQLQAELATTYARWEELEAVARG